MTKIVINKCYGGFGLSEEAIKLYFEKIGNTGVEFSTTSYGRLSVVIDGKYWYDWRLQRDDPILVEVIEELGLGKASGAFASLDVVEIPDGIDWRIEEYDGKEWVSESHKTWS
jgi:hypothetical protein